MYIVPRESSDLLSSLGELEEQYPGYQGPPKNIPPFTPLDLFFH